MLDIDYEETEETEETMRLMTVKKLKGNLRNFSAENSVMSITEKQRRIALESSYSAMKTKSFVRDSLTPLCRSDENFRRRDKIKFMKV